MTETLIRTVAPLWLRLWAVLTVCVALPLVLLGAETTTKGVGMADQVSLRSPWYFFTLDLADTPLGLLIEHSHRLFGWAVGMCCIVLAIGVQLTMRDRRRWLGWLALVVVSLQGVFGILRVKWNALAGPELAAFHGCFAQLTFATLVGVALSLSTSWSSPRTLELARPALAICVLVYVQIVFGAIVRHRLSPTAQRLHILLAFAVVLAIGWLVARIRSAPEAAGRRWAMLLLILVLIQPVFGIEAWMRRFGAATLPELVQPSFGLDLARSIHHLLGTLIFSTTVALTVLLCRPRSGESVRLPVPQSLGGAA